MSEKIMNILKDFMSDIEDENIEIYNEFSLQHELGIYLRKKLSNFKVQFERNVNYFGISDTIKHEIDIVVFNETEKYSIELKYPKNGQYPEQMFSFIKDIKFMEQLKENGFNASFCVTLADDKNFYEGKRIDGIYSYFRGKNLIHGTIRKPTGSKNEEIFVNGSYYAEWEKNNKYSYYIIEVR